MWCFRKNVSFFFVVAVVLATVTACAGFRPLYSRDAGGNSIAATEMARTKILPIEDRVGQQLHNNLLDLMTPRGAPANPAYVLSVRLTTSTSELGIRKTGFATRANLNANASITLTDVATSKTLLSGSHRIVGGYDLLDSEYATLVSEKNAKRRAAAELAHAIRSQVSVYFLQRAEGKTKP